MSKVNTKSAILKQIAALTKQLAALQAQADAHDEVDTGEVPAPDIAARIKSQKFSYGVEFTRKGNDTFTSKRRFSSCKEATQHGTRFAKKHRHQGFCVVKVSQRANAWINWKTGKTNPVL